jgi:acetyl esterase/lipase
MKFSCAVALVGLPSRVGLSGGRSKRGAGRLAAIARSHADPDLAGRSPRPAIRPGSGSPFGGGGDQRDPAHDDGLFPNGKNTGAAIVVFPGGGFQMLAIDLEGTEVCDWLTSKGVTCVLLKYRVPSAPYVWQCDCRPHNRSISTPSLQDAQRTLRLVRSHAAEWGIDPHKVGVLGFSAGGYLVAEVSTTSRLAFMPRWTLRTEKAAVRISPLPFIRGTSP